MLLTKTKPEEGTDVDDVLDHRSHHAYGGGSRSIEEGVQIRSCRVEHEREQTNSSASRSTLLLVAVSRLGLAGQLIAFSIDDSQVVVRQFARSRLCCPSDLPPVSFDTIPTGLGLSAGRM